MCIIPIYQYYLFMNYENQIHLFVVAEVIKVVGGMSVVLQNWVASLLQIIGNNKKRIITKKRI